MNFYRLLIVAALVSSCAEKVSEVESPASAPTSTSAPASLAADSHAHHHGPEKRPKIDNVERVLEKLEATVGLHKARFDKDPKLVVSGGILIGAYSTKAKLTGKLAPYKDALDVAQKAEKAIPGIGARDAHANLLSTLHRNKKALTLADASLKHPLISSDAKAALLSLKANIAWQNGDGESARQLHQEALALHGRPNIQAPIATFKFEQGKTALAIEMMDKALKFPQQKSGLSYAWLTLQRGILELEQGRYQKAAEYFDKADRAMPGWYLVQEHQAEVMVKLGQNDKAKALYKDIIKRTNNPEFMDALADISSDEEAKILRQKARAEYEKMLKEFPEVAYVHGVDHFAHDDAERALTLAKKSVALRPGGAQQNVLAERYLAMGDVKNAEEAWRLAEKTGYRTHDFHRVGFELFDKLGTPEAAVQKAAALAINPHALD